MCVRGALRGGLSAFRYPLTRSCHACFCMRACTREQEKQIKSCQTKIDKAQEEYIRLKQIKNAQIKLANQEAEEAGTNEENQESETD